LNDACKRTSEHPRVRIEFQRNELEESLTFRLIIGCIMNTEVDGLALSRFEGNTVIYISSMPSIILSKSPLEAL